jgi:hypothetical protein
MYILFYLMREGPFIFDYLAEYLVLRATGSQEQPTWKAHMCQFFDMGVVGRWNGPWEID